MCVEGKHYANINIYMKTPRQCLNSPLKQMNTEIGKVRTMRIIDPSVASTSIGPLAFPSAGARVGREKILMKSISICRFVIFCAFQLILCNFTSIHITRVLIISRKRMQLAHAVPHSHLTDSLVHNQTPWNDIKVN